MKTRSKTRHPSVKKAASPRKTVRRNKAQAKVVVGKKSPQEKPPASAARKAALKTQTAPVSKKTPVLKGAAAPPARGRVMKLAAGRKTVRVVSRELVTLSSPMMMASGVIARVDGVVPAVRRPGHAIVTARRSRKPRLLWIGDACVPTGFATVTHAVLRHLSRDWDVVVSGVNYDGSAHDLPYTIMPAGQGGDMWGVNRFRDLCAELDPAAVVINNDWWNVAKFARVAPAGVPVVGYMPVDGGNLDPADMRAFKKLHAAVWYTAYGHREAVKAGFKGVRHVIPHGIDPKQFHPVDRSEARRLLDLNVPKNAFIVGNLNRNQPRKRLDLTVQIFADWVKQHRVPNAFLLMHCAQKDSGWDLRRVAAFHGVADRLLLTGGEDMRDLQSIRHLQLIYSCLDVQVSTTLGEGWGLTTMEGMACGVPQIVPDSSALAEWAVPAVKVPCTRMLMHPEICTTGALVDDKMFVSALHSLHQDKALRARISVEGLALVRQGGFQWKTAARQFHQILVSTLSRKRARQLTTA